MRFSGLLGTILIIAMLFLGVWFGCKGEQEGGGRAQYEENIDQAKDATSNYSKSAEESESQAQEQMKQ